MVSQKQKLFNSSMDDYIKQKRRTPFNFSFKLPKTRRKAEAMEVEELKKTDTQRRGLFQKIYDALFATKAEIQEEQFETEFSDELPAETPPEPKSYLDSIKNILFKNPEPEFIEPEPQIKKVFLYKPKTEQDAKQLILIIESMQKNMSVVDRHRFQHSKHFNEYEKLKAKYSQKV
ncbi:MAG: hypothetical protein ABIG95_05415 [Candidatus Woesearchaeota archaeon]